MPRVSLLILLCSLFLVSGCENGCGTRQPEPGPESLIPADAAGRRREFARRLPLGTPVTVMVDSFGDLAASFEAVKGRIRNIFDLGAVESEIRNTFGVDLNRRVTFRENGIAYDAGFALALVQQHPILILFLLDPEPFLQQAQLVLRRQPFNLRAPIQTEQVGNYQIQLFARRTNLPPEVAVVTDGVIALVVTRATGGPSVAELARTLAGTGPEASLATNPDFELQLARFPDYSLFFYLDAVAASAVYQEQLAGQLEPLEAFALSQFNSSVLGVGAGLRIEETQLQFRGYLSVTDQVVQLATGIDSPEGTGANLSSFLSPSTIIALRVGVNPRILWNTILHFQGERGAELLRRRLRPMEELFGATIESDLTQIWSGQAAITINRVSLLTLLQGTRFTDIADALNLVAVAQLEEPERAGQILEGLAATEEDPYQRSTEPGVVRYACRRATPCFGQLMIGRDLLVLSADRVHRWAMARLNESSEEQLADLAPEARELMSQTNATGFFVSFGRLLPLATILNYPQVVRDFLGLVDTLVVRMESDASGMLVNGLLTLTAVE
ncbi:MAG: hypothetical protein JW797_03405 [Bradymonadales bacterium]|nr:hypothetical protein [Bradymonadales bacterium]